MAADRGSTQDLTAILMGIKEDIGELKGGLKSTHDTVKVLVEDVKTMNRDGCGFGVTLHNRLKKVENGNRGISFGGAALGGGGAAVFVTAFKNFLEWWTP